MTVSDEVDRAGPCPWCFCKDIDNDDMKPYRIFNQAEIIERLDMVTNTLTVLITLIALVALVVGSIGIMNIMLSQLLKEQRR